MTVEMINALDEAPFVAALGWVFEHSPWVAERAYASGPFASVKSLHRAMAEQVDRAPREEQLALLRAHPDLGTRAKLSLASAGEQRGAGLDEMSAEELALFTGLNEAYRSRFGFPFLYAVKGSTRADILNAMQQRLGSTPEAEFKEALRQVYRIAEFRLGELIDGTVRQRLEE